MGRKPIVGGNWKCNIGTLQTATDLLDALKGSPFDAGKLDVVMCPSAIHVMSVKEHLESMGMNVSTQNVSASGFGAFTGELAADHLVDCGIGWTLIGHSERRKLYGETDAEAAKKMEKCQDKGIKVIFCIGESLDEREAGKTDEVNKRQLAAVLPAIKDWDTVVIAYEPVWAIGTGKVATPEQAQDAHAAIRAYLRDAVSPEVAEKVRIQYGGSVKPENCAELISKPDIDGFLVGGASTKPSFGTIISTVEGAA
jgi:triosephosphate isomerase